jgi:hypothetical protein
MRQSDLPLVVLLLTSVLFVALSGCDSTQQQDSAPIQEDPQGEDPEDGEGPEEEEPKVVALSGSYGGTTNDRAIGLDLELSDDEGELTGSGTLTTLGSSYPVELVGTRRGSAVGGTISGEGFGDFDIIGRYLDDGRVRGTLTRMHSYYFTLSPEAASEPVMGDLAGRLGGSTDSEYFRLSMDSLMDQQGALQADARLRWAMFCGSHSDPREIRREMILEGTHTGAEVHMLFRSSSSSNEDEWLEFRGDFRIYHDGDRGIEGALTGAMEFPCSGNLIEVNFGDYTFRGSGS